MRVQQTTYAILASFATLVPAFSLGQTWNYQAYREGGIPSSPGYVTLEGTDAEARFQIVAGTLGRCYQGSLKANVRRTDSSIVITTIPRMTGCEQARFVIKSDGTGGTRETLQETEWVPDGFERNLTLRK